MPHGNLTQGSQKPTWVLMPVPHDGKRSGDRDVHAFDCVPGIAASRHHSPKNDGYRAPALRHFRMGSMPHSTLPRSGSGAVRVPAR
jgi:hypothetical protein